MEMERLEKSLTFEYLRVFQASSRLARRLLLSVCPGQVLVNALTGQLKLTQNHMSGKATNQELAFSWRLAKTCWTASNGGVESPGYGRSSHWDKCLRLESHSIRATYVFRLFCCGKYSCGEPQVLRAPEDSLLDGLAEPPTYSWAFCLSRNKNKK
jgi:hypothetical protein